jgi:RimJ/RimL family protein N-acetyltransferase
VGATLVAEAERVAAERGVAVVYAGIFAANQAAVDFYSACGFRPRGILLSRDPGRPA